MPYSFPPLTAHDLTPHLKQFESCSDYLYISTPMTSGITYLEYKDEVGEVDAAAKQCIWSVNFANANLLALRVQKLNADREVLNPFTFQDNSDQKGWVGDDYLAYWDVVISNQCSKLFFVDFWEYSFGCAYEFLVATRNNIPTFDSSSYAISLSQGMRMIEKAIQNYEETYHECACFLKSIYRELMRIEFEKDLSETYGECDVCK